MSSQRDHQEQLERILDGLAESIEGATTEELLAEVQASRRDPKIIAERVKNILLQAVKRYEQRKLDAARTACRARSASALTKRRCLPETPHQRREQLFAVCRNTPRLGEVLTFQHRGFEDLSDEDVQTALEDLAELGFLDDWAQTSH